MCGRSQFRKVPEIIEEFGPARVGDIVDAALADEAFPKSVVPGLGAAQGGAGHLVVLLGLLRRRHRPQRPPGDGLRPAGLAGRLRRPPGSSCPWPASSKGRAWFAELSGGPLAVAGLYRLGALPPPRRPAAPRPPRRATMLTRPADDVVAPVPRAHAGHPPSGPDRPLAGRRAGAAGPAPDGVARPQCRAAGPPGPPTTGAALAPLTGNASDAGTGANRPGERGEPLGTVPAGDSACHRPGQVPGMGGQHLDIRDDHSTGEDGLGRGAVLATEAGAVAAEWRELSPVGAGAAPPSTVPPLGGAGDRRGGRRPQPAAAAGVGRRRGGRQSRRRLHRPGEAGRHRRTDLPPGATQPPLSGPAAADRGAGHGHASR